MNRKFIITISENNLQWDEFILAYNNSKIAKFYKKTGKKPTAESIERPSAPF